MSGQNKPQPGNEPLTGSIEEALDHSMHELQLLANFYHQHGFPERAQEIYRTLLKLRRDRNTLDRHGK